MWNERKVGQKTIYTKLFKSLELKLRTPSLKERRTANNVSFKMFSVNLKTATNFQLFLAQIRTSLSRENEQGLPGQ